ncbi:MAG TPA: hypothetical protein PLU17_05370 [Chitinophagaceae bacterium]|nr:hypothetical protein [Chitinophagaceae bacterium]
MKSKITLLIIFTLLTFFSCKKKDTPSTPGGSSGPALTSNYYFQANIDGVWITFQEDMVYTSSYGSQEESIGDSIKAHREIGAISNDLDSVYAKEGGISGVFTDVLWYNVDSNNYNLLFSTGTKAFGKYKGLTGSMNGFIIHYVENGVEWRSDNGSANQSGSSIVITDLSINSIDFLSQKIVKATFSCKLYNDSGASKTLTNGKFRGRILQP